MDRRAFVAGSLSLLAVPLAAEAQQPNRMRQIGVLMGFAESDSAARAYVAAFREGLQKLGWTEGRNIRIHLRWAALAREARA
jgi:putative tryptophan/tyrosine transport system substrate-binding protein